MDRRKLMSPVLSVIIRNLFFLVGVAVIFGSCKESSSEPLDEYQYFPLADGNYWVYEVKQTAYASGSSQAVSSAWQERDVVAGSEQNGAVTTYKIERSVKNTTTGYWQLSKIYSIDKYPEKIVINMDSKSYVSMIFPLGYAKWDGNQYNNSGEEMYQYLNVGQPDSTATDIKTVRVLERDSETLINKYLGFRVYGHGRGLLREVQISFEYCQTETCIGSGRVDSGNRLERNLLEYGSI